jgi:hypothetical protein
MKMQKYKLKQKAIYTVVGFAIGAILSILFVKMGSPGLIGVGAAIGMSISISLNARQES